MPARNFGKQMAYLEYMYYGPGQRYLSQEDRVGVFKADTDITTGVTGVYQAKYGADVWYQTSHEANAFGVLPKYPGTKTGWRVITTDVGASADGGVAQNGAIPDTGNPTYAVLSAIPKTVAHSFGVSEVHEAVAQAGNDTTADMEASRRYHGSIHKRRLNQQLLLDVGTTANTRFESIDRVCSAFSEISPSGIDANDADIYGQDRDAAAGWTDAYVDSGASGVDRDITDTILLGMLDNTREVGANSTMWLTGTDTYASIQQLFEPQVRYSVLKDTKIQVSTNGIQSPSGIDVGLTVSELYGLPVIISSSVPKDTISRVYLLDTSDPEGFGVPRLGVRVHKPTQYFETGMNQGNPFAIDKFGNQGVYRTMGELIAYNFGVQAKARDLR